jgi:hypothetical protein
MEAHDCNFHDELRLCINARCPLHRAMRTLAANLASCAALCEAFELGYEQNEHERLYSNHGYRTEQDWRPGCQRPVPGYVEKLEVGR